MKEKERLDLLVFERGFASSREKAKALIMTGQVYVDGRKEDKAGSAFLRDALIEIRGEGLPYVSRGGLKLKKALDAFSVDLSERICLDVGSSTGGFTDCMLQSGAKKVYAIDVGYGQLAWALRNDPRVVVMEKTNIRYVEPADISEKADFASVDVSFISLALVLSPVRNLLKDDAEAVCLIKPQFEAGREEVGKKGVVRDRKIHEKVIGEVCAAAELNDFSLLALDHSPITGPEGNIEYLLHLKAGEGRSETLRIKEAVEQAHASLAPKGEARI